MQSTRTNSATDRRVHQSLRGRAQRGGVGVPVVPGGIGEGRQPKQHLGEVGRMPLVRTTEDYVCSTRSHCRNQFMVLCSDLLDVVEGGLWEARSTWQFQKVHLPDVVEVRAVRHCGEASVAFFVAFDHRWKRVQKF